jgi:hypothetical protein
MQMPAPIAARFDEVLEAVESLSDEHQENLIDIVRRRQIERRREALAIGIQEARKDLARGAVRRGSLDDLLGEL